MHFAHECDMFNFIHCCKMCTCKDETRYLHLSAELIMALMIFTCIQITNDEIQLNYLRFHAVTESCDFKPLWKYTTTMLSGD